jgi:hypothetical protein
VVGGLHGLLGRGLATPVYLRDRVRGGPGVGQCFEVLKMFSCLGGRLWLQRWIKRE